DRLHRRSGTKKDLLDGAGVESRQTRLACSRPRAKEVIEQLLAVSVRSGNDGQANITQIGPGERYLRGRYVDRQNLTGIDRRHRERAGEDHVLGERIRVAGDQSAGQGRRRQAQISDMNKAVIYAE